MNKQDITNVRLGAKQIPLGFEKDPVQEQNVVASCVRDYAEQHGEVVFHRFVEYVKERHGYALADILQLIFWLASDQEIRFRANGKAFSPHEVKKMLLESPDAEVFLIFHQPVEDVVLEKVQYFYAQLTGRQAPLILSDPHDLSRLLAKQIRYWTDCLNACRHGVEKPGYPGKKILADGLFLINKISARLDPFSLIYAFYENQEERSEEQHV